MMREVFCITTFDDEVEVAEVVKVALGEVLEFLGPNDCDSHVLSGVGYDGTGQKIGIHCHKALLIEAEVGKKLSILFEILCKSVGRFVAFCPFKIGADRDLVHVLIFEEAALGDEESHIVVDGIYHQVPVDFGQDHAFHLYDVVWIISAINFLVECISSRILDLKILS
jgi:hypothetical protein